MFFWHAAILSCGRCPRAISEHEGQARQEWRILIQNRFDLVASQLLLAHRDDLLRTGAEPWAVSLNYIATSDNLSTADTLEPELYIVFHVFQVEVITSLFQQRQNGFQLGPLHVKEFEDQQEGDSASQIAIP